MVCWHRHASCCDWRVCAKFTLYSHYASYTPVDNPLLNNLFLTWCNSIVKNSGSVAGCFAIHRWQRADLARRRSCYRPIACASAVRRSQPRIIWHKWPMTRSAPAALPRLIEAASVPPDGREIIRLTRGRNASPNSARTGKAAAVRPATCRPTLTRHLDHRPHQRIDLLRPAPPVEHAVMPGAGLQVMALHRRADAGAQFLRRHRLADGADVV